MCSMYGMENIIGLYPGWFILRIGFESSESCLDPTWTWNLDPGTFQTFDFQQLHFLLHNREKKTFKGQSLTNSEVDTDQTSWKKRIRIQAPKVHGYGSSVLNYIKYMDCKIVRSFSELSKIQDIIQIILTEKQVGKNICFWHLNRKSSFHSCSSTKIGHNIMWDTDSNTIICPGSSDPFYILTFYIKLLLGYTVRDMEHGNVGG